MLVLRRKPGQWVTVTHTETGDVLRIRVYHSRNERDIEMAFDDTLRNFLILRPERIEPLTIGATADEQH